MADQHIIEVDETDIYPLPDRAAYSKGVYSTTYPPNPLHVDILTRQPHLQTIPIAPTRAGGILTKGTNLLNHPLNKSSTRLIGNHAIPNIKASQQLFDSINTTSGDTGDAIEEENGELREVMIELHNIHKTYLLGIEGVAALRGITLKIFKGEWVAIYGTSGGGKTSLLNVIGTIDKPTKGDIKICGTLINNNTPDDVFADLRLKRLGFVFQSFNLISSMTAIENVELPMILKGKLSPAERKSVAKASLEKVGMGHRLNQFPNKLSGGEQQRVTIARALANAPELLLLDEPTGDLDTVNSNKVISLLHHLNKKQQMTMVMVTHDVYLKNFCHRIIYIRDGKIGRIEKVPKVKRDAALVELFKKISSQEEKMSKKSTADLFGSLLALSSIPTQHSSFSNLKSQPSFSRIDNEGQPIERAFGNCTEVREPSDYETFSKNCGVPANIPNEFFLQTYADDLSNLEAMRRK